MNTHTTSTGESAAVEEVVVPRSHTVFSWQHVLQRCPWLASWGGRAAAAAARSRGDEVSKGPAGCTSRRRTSAAVCGGVLRNPSVTTTSNAAAAVSSPNQLVAFMSQTPTLKEQERNISSSSSSSSSSSNGTTRPNAGNGVSETAGGVWKSRRLVDTHTHVHFQGLEETVQALASLVASSSIALFSPSSAGSLPRLPRPLLAREPHADSVSGTVGGSVLHRAGAETDVGFAIQLPRTLVVMSTFGRSCLMGVGDSSSNCNDDDDASSSSSSSAAAAAAAAGVAKTKEWVADAAATAIAVEGGFRPPKGDWKTVASLAAKFPHLVVPAFGIHPWCVCVRACVCVRVRACAHSF